MTEMSSKLKSLNRGQGEKELGGGGPAGENCLEQGLMGNLASATPPRHRCWMYGMIYLRPGPITTIFLCTLDFCPHAFGVFGCRTAQKDF